MPLFTYVSVPSQRSSVNQFVPRTVAALYRPFVRNLPLPLPHRWRTLFFFGGGVVATLASFRFPQTAKSPPVSVSVVSSVLSCVATNLPAGHVESRLAALPVLRNRDAQCPLRRVEDEAEAEFRRRGHGTNGPPGF